LSVRVLMRVVITGTAVQRHLYPVSRVTDNVLTFKRQKGIVFGPEIGAMSLATLAVKLACRIV